MNTRRVVYVCPNKHELIFGHQVSKRGKFQSPSPVVCGCGSIYWLAFIGGSAAPNSVFLSRFNGVSKTINFDWAIITKFFGNNRG